MLGASDLIGGLAPELKAIIAAPKSREVSFSQL